MSKNTFNKKGNSYELVQSRRIRIQAKNLEQALYEAEKKLGVEKSRLKYEIISQTGLKIFSFLGFSKVEVDVWVEKTPVMKTSSRIETIKKKRPIKEAIKINKKKYDKDSKKDRKILDQDQPFSQPLSFDDQMPDEGLTPLTDAEYQRFIQDSTSFTIGLCSYLSDTPVRVQTQLVQDRLIVNIDNEEIKDLFHKNPKLYESIEHLIRKKPRYLKRELPFRVFVDSCGQRLEKEKSLVVLALDMASKVSATQKPIVLDYKSPADRRIIHMALDKNEFVYTKSIGSGSNRKLMILPNTSSGHGSDFKERA